eukprot:GSMAST32.ASY1.ANO1.77.1 assembled CDS
MSKGDGFFMNAFKRVRSVVIGDVDEPENIKAMDTSTATEANVEIEQRPMNTSTSDSAVAQPKSKMDNPFELPTSPSQTPKNTIPRKGSASKTRLGSGFFSRFGRGKGTATPGVVKYRGAAFPPRRGASPTSKIVKTGTESSSPGVRVVAAEPSNSNPDTFPRPVILKSASTSESSIRPATSVSNTPRSSSLNDVSDSPSSSVTALAISADVADQTKREKLNFSQKEYKYEKFEKLFSADNVDIKILQKQTWNGCPQKYRAMSWQMLLGYLPYNRRRREATIDRKRKEYAEFVRKYYKTPGERRTKHEQQILRQILVDVPRTRPNVPLFHQPIIRRLLERVLYIWALRHPASGYVQGINDLATPFIVAFLAQRLKDSENPLCCDVESLEADTFWCLTKLIDGIQDHYTFAQPGLQKMVYKLKELMCRIDPKLNAHFEKCGIDYMQFAFRWMNCLLLRELSLPHIIRLWDACISEENGFRSFHVFLCAAFLKRWSKHLLELEFQSMLTFLQDIPTDNWTIDDIEELLGEAYVLKTLYEQGEHHLRR